ncbi:MAG: hypothetical protein ABSE63_09830 [Thermoguttaceae bacterium]
MMTALDMLLFGNSQCTAGSAADGRNADCMLSARPNSFFFRMLRHFPGSIVGLALTLLSLEGQF